MRKFIYILVVFLFFISCNDETGISVGNDVGGIKMRLGNNESVFYRLF